MLQRRGKGAGRLPGRYAAVRLGAGPRASGRLPGGLLLARSAGGIYLGQVGGEGSGQLGGLLPLVGSGLVGLDLSRPPLRGRLSAGLLWCAFPGSADRVAAELVMHARAHEGEIVSVSRLSLAHLGSEFLFEALLAAVRGGAIIVEVGIQSGVSGAELSKLGPSAGQLGTRVSARYGLVSVVVSRPG